MSFVKPDLVNKSGFIFSRQKSKRFSLLSPLGEGFLKEYLCTSLNTASSAAPKIPEETGIEPTTVATFALPVRRSKRKISSTSG
jgi:hypothetical protein